MTAGPGLLIANLLGGDPTHQLAQSLAGPNPSPQAAPPQQPGGTAPPPQAPAQAPAQATQSNPNAANLIEQLMRVQQRAQGIEAINSGLEGFASHFGTAQQQASKVAALGRGGGADDPLGTIKDSLKIQDAAQTQREHDALMRDPEAIGRMLGLQPGEGTVAANAGMLPDMLKAHYATQLPTSNMRDVNAETEEWKKANPDATPQEIAAHRANMLSGLIGGPMAAAASAHAVDAQKFKDQGVEDFAGANDKLTRGEDTVDRLLKSIPATMTALGTPDRLTSGKEAAWLGKIPVIGGMITPSETTRSLAAGIRTLKAELTGQGLTDVKNVRNRMEFETLGNALTAALDAANSPQDVERALIEIKRKFETAKGNAYARAGKEVPSQYAGVVDPVYLTKTDANGNPNPFYTGATIAKGDGAPTPQSRGGPRRRHYNEQGELVE